MALHLFLILCAGCLCSCSSSPELTEATARLDKAIENYNNIKSHTPSRRNPAVTDRDYGITIGDISINNSSCHLLTSNLQKVISNSKKLNDSERDKLNQYCRSKTGMDLFRFMNECADLLNAMGPKHVNRDTASLHTCSGCGKDIYVFDQQHSSFYTVNCYYCGTSKNNY